MLLPPKKLHLEVHMCKYKRCKMRCSNLTLYTQVSSAAGTLQCCCHPNRFILKCTWQFLICFVNRNLTRMGHQLSPIRLLRGLIRPLRLSLPGRWDNQDQEGGRGGMGVKNFLRHQAKTKALTLRRLIVTLRPLRRPICQRACKMHHGGKCARGVLGSSR